MENMMLKPNLVMFQRDNETKDTVSINCFEIVSITSKFSDIEEDRNKVEICLKNGIRYTILGTVQELHSRILRS